MNIYTTAGGANKEKADLSYTAFAAVT